MSRANILFVLATLSTTTACLSDVPEADDADLLIEKKGIPNTPDNTVRVVSVNFYKGSFGEEKSDARNFLHYLAHDKWAPDILAVQNLAHGSEGFHDCADVARKMEKYLEPKTVNYGYYYPNVTGGACVIYRSGRFQRIAETAGLGAWHGDSCSEQGMSSVGVRLRDTKFHDKIISIVSVHMPGECTKKNSTEIATWVDAGHSDMTIVAGDFNTNTGDPTRWGSIPAMREVFEGDNFRAGGTDLWGPLDWLWRKGASSAANTKRVEFAEASGAGSPNPGMNYSDHRGGFEDLTY